MLSSRQPETRPGLNMRGPVENAVGGAAIRLLITVAGIVEILLRRNR